MIDRPRWQLAVAAAAVALLVLGVYRWTERTRAAPAATVSLGRPAEPRPGPRERRSVFVHVAGAVRRPGVYALPRGSRGGDAVERAGGPRRNADLAAVNLAAPMRDGQQLVVPVRGAAGAPGAGGGPARGAAAGALSDAASTGAERPGSSRLSLTTATAAELEELDGIGPALAARIVAYREAHGGFRSVAELAEVEGIGDKRLAALEQAVVP